MISSRPTKMHGSQRLLVSKLPRVLSWRQKMTSKQLPPSDWWRIVKRVSGNGRSQSVPTLRDPDGHEYTASAGKADCMARYFASKCSHGQDDLSAPFPYVRPRTDQALSDVRFCVAAVERTLWQLKPSKATGPDRIPARVLKTCSAELAQPLSILFTQCFQTGIL